jgi:hypothetical protein
VKSRNTTFAAWTLLRVFAAIDNQGNTLIVANVAGYGPRELPKTGRGELGRTSALSVAVI